MADEDTSKPKRSMKPKPGVIDLEATEIEREAPPPPVEEPAAAKSEEPILNDEVLGEPEPIEDEPRSPLGALIAAGIAGAAISLSAFVLLLALGLIPIGSSGDPALGNRVAQLENQLAAAASTAVPTPVEPDTSALRSEIAALRQDLEALRNAAPPAPAPDTALQTRVAELAARIDTLASAPADDAALNELRGRIDQVAEQANAAREPDPAAQDALRMSKGASALAAFAVVESAVSRGVPYNDALEGLRRQWPEADLAGLETDADKGLPSTAVLARDYERDLEAAPPPDTQSSGLADRLAEGARSLVRIRPVAGSPDADKIDPADPWSARNVIATRLRSGNYAGAIEGRSQLDAVAQKATEEAAGKLAARLNADKALDRLRTEVTARAEAKN